jgi:hypothetical protein
MFLQSYRCGLLRLSERICKSGGLTLFVLFCLMQTIARSESRKQQSEMEELLRTFVGIRTVSVNRSQAGQDQAWKGANFLKGLLENIGAEVKLVVGQENTNPVVMGRLIQVRQEGAVFQLMESNETPSQFERETFDLS